MKATIIVPPISVAPPQMPVEGAVVAEVFDSLGWAVYFLDVAAFNMTGEAVRVETEKEKPDLVALMINRWQYRYAKQYVAPLRKALPAAALVAVTDLKPVELLRWLPEIDFAIKGPPSESLRMLASRTRTRNFEGISETGLGGKVVLPQYHPLTTNFEHHARLRGGRLADIPTKLFGEQVEGDNLVETVVSLRLKYAIQGFNLLGDINDVNWLTPILKGFEEKELTGAPVNLTWTCTIPDPMQLSTPMIRSLADHGCKVLMFQWRDGIRDQIEHVINTSQSAGIQPFIRLMFGGGRTIYEYLAMTELLRAYENLPIQARFVEDETRLDDEEYVSSLTNGAYPPKSINVHYDIEQVAAKELVLNRDVDRLRKLAVEVSN